MINSLIIYLFGVCVLLLEISLIAEVEAVCLDEAWNLFKSNYNKNCGVRLSEEPKRKAIFAGNKQFIEQFNRESNQTGFQLGINHLSDWTQSEFDQLNGNRLIGVEKLRNSPEQQEFIQKILADETSKVPNQLDWRHHHGRVTPVKDQGKCGSDWAFSTTGVLEGQEIRHNNTHLLGLSEQNLIDCSGWNLGCFGGNMRVALDFVNSQGGIEDECSYPYEAKTNRCRFDKSNVVMTDSGAATLPMGDEWTLKQMVAKFGPVSVAIDASVLVVGYGTDRKFGDYWIVKNSWSTDWGENGYIRMARNRNNNCGIATDATIPTF